MTTLAKLTPGAVVERSRQVILEGEEWGAIDWSWSAAETPKYLKLASAVIQALRKRGPRIQGGVLRAYRMILAGHVDEIDLHHLGLSWTWNLKTIDDRHGESFVTPGGEKFEYVIDAAVPEKSVDWVLTAALLFVGQNPPWGVARLPSTASSILLGEHELRMRHRAPIRVQAVRVRNAPEARGGRRKFSPWESEPVGEWVRFLDTGAA